MHLLTFTGRTFSPLAPKAADIAIEDIAHALSRLNRFGGHIGPEDYSVAQHSVLVSRAVPTQYALWALLHDASEAYLGDVVKPLKHTAAMAPYRAIEAVVQRTIYQRFGLVGDEPEAVRAADDALAILEAEALFTPPAPWAAEKRAKTTTLPAINIVPVSADKAKAGFLKRFADLTAGRLP